MQRAYSDRLLARSNHRLSVLRFFAVASAISQLTCPPLWAQQSDQLSQQPPSSGSPSLNRSISAESTPSKDFKLPILRLKDGFHLNRALGDEEWILVSLSALSQNNGTTSGLPANKATSSNLFSLGLQIGPFDPAVNKQHSSETEVIPRPGMERAKSSRIYQRLALNALFTQRAGQILSFDIPNILNSQWNFGNGPIARLNILNLEYRNPVGLVSSIKLGKLMQAQDFTVNRVQCFYSNFGLCGWAQATPQMVQIPGNPFNSYGAVLKIGQEDKTRLKYGVYQLAPETYQPQYHGLNFRFDQAIGTAHFFELNIPLQSPSLIPVHTQLLPGYSETQDQAIPNALYETPLPPTTLTLGGWLANGKFSVIQASGLTAKYGNQNNAVYGIASLRLPLSWLGMDNRVFAASSVGFNPDVQNFRSGGNAGLVIAGLLPNRPFDTFSLGTAYAVFNPSFYYGGIDPSSFTPSSELAFEVNYNLAINKSVSIMPNYQYIVRPSGDASRSGVSILGVQIWLRF